MENNRNTLEEDLQVIKAASLADTDAPENLNTLRAHEFVGKTLGKKKVPQHHRWLRYGVVAFAVAASITVAVILPSNSGYRLNEEMEDIHFEIDSTSVQNDSLQEQNISIEIFSIDE